VEKDQRTVLEEECSGCVEDIREIAKIDIRQLGDETIFLGGEERQKNRLKKKSVV
jgi:hypothetical protein